MTHNVGGLDRKLRTWGGLSALSFAVMPLLGRKMRMVALALGAVELLTAKTRYCPMNQALGINTYQSSRLGILGRVLGRLTKR